MTPPSHTRLTPRAAQLRRIPYVPHQAQPGPRRTDHTQGGHAGSVQDGGQGRVQGRGGGSDPGELGAELGATPTSVSRLQLLVHDTHQTSVTPHITHQ